MNPPDPLTPADPFAPANTVANGPVAEPERLPPIRPRASSGSSRALNVALTLAAVFAVGGVAFAVGRLSAPSAAASGAGGDRLPIGPGNGFVGRPGASGAPGNGRFTFEGGLTLEGTVVSHDATSMTIRTASGSTVTVALSGETTYHRQADAAASDVSDGAQVLVRLNGGRGGGIGADGPGASAAPGASGGPRLGSATSVTLVR